MKLYDHQLKANREVWRQQEHRDAQSVLLQASTGAGKTVSSSHMAKMRQEHAGDQILFLAHRREIIYQAAKTLTEAAGLTTGIIMGGEKRNPYAQVQVASIDTLRSREFPDAQYVIFDEAHRIAGSTQTKIYEHYKAKGSKILLLTATPMRTDGRGLKQYADVMVKMPSMRWLIEHEFLVAPRYRVGAIPDLKGVKIVAGDFNSDQVQEVMMGRKLVGDVVDNYIAHARYRRSMLFASGVKHSLHLVEKLKDAGVKAVHIDGDTPKDVRDRAKAMMEDGSIELISNAQVYIEGTDIPCIDCIIDGNDTKSLTKYLQAGGRGLRTMQGKYDLLYLAHSGNFARHGRLEADRDWELTEGKEQLEKFEKERKETERVQIPCKNCGFILKSAVCGQCGYQFVPQGKHKDCLPGMLVEMTEAEFDRAGKQNPKVSKDDKAEFYSQLLGYAHDHGKSTSWALANYHEKFKEWPYKKNSAVPTQPQVEVLKWVHGRRIAFIKGKQAQQKRAAHQPWGGLVG